MKIPYRTEASVCYERLKMVNNVYRDGFEQLRREAGGAQPFHERISKLLQEHSVILANGKQAPPLTQWREEDVYLCCLYDLLEAMFIAEAEGRLAQGDENAVENMLEELKKIPFESPKWKNGARAQIEKALQQMQKNVGGKR